MPNPIKNPKIPVTGKKLINLNKKEVNSAIVSTQNAIAKQMGTTAAKLPADVNTNIELAVKNALDSRVNYLIQRDADKAVKDTVLAGAKPLELLDSRISAAQAGVRFVTGDAKVEAVLEDTAKLLWKKYQALKKAGFTDDQSYELLLAEVTGRASRNK